MGNRKVKKRILLLPILLIIPFLAFFLYLTISGVHPTSTWTLLTGSKISKVNYETFNIYIDESLPESLKTEIESQLSEIVYEGTPRFNFVDNNKADYSITNQQSNPIYKETYIPVGHIYWVKGDIEIKDICNNTVYVSEETTDLSIALLKGVLGKDCTFVKTSDLLTKIKSSESSIAFVQPNELEKGMKILKVNDKGYLEDNSASISYSYGLESERENLDFVSSIITKNITTSVQPDLDLSNLVKINMTGVTAITRGLASLMDKYKDYDYPAKSIGDFLADADLTHVSNEISFVSGCTSYSGMRFCSRPEYMETLKASGVDIVELTGNHNNDYGASANTNTINMYKEEGMDYFGGGLDDTDASKILYKEVNGSTIAFLGYNYYDTMLKSGAIATSSHAGANSYSVEKMQSNIKEAKENADAVIVDFQFQECYSYPSSDVIYPICYKPLSSPDQKGVFRKAIDFGADIVIGAQAHQPQTYELYNGGTIFYGLGNLYFDQTRWIGTRQGLVVSIYILDGEVIQTELTPTIYENDMVTRLAKPDEAKLLLDLLKSARTF